MRGTSGQCSLSCSLEFFFRVVVDGVDLLDECFHLLLQDVGVVTKVTFVWFELYHLLFVVSLDDASVEYDYSEDEGST